ncbi:hypothetical protein [Sodalis sp. CWE]|uniref:hypothetical protein n=1 Tax=Sodalis sp. CWE TaxID=2803816 RepID=UPI001C7DE756|nr:hypothetical protein [Sodalis sp. CWE]MBX4181196.1 hypothetical protein [Sodalis sp. CWE]
MAIQIQNEKKQLQCNDLAIFLVNHNSSDDRWLGNIINEQPKIGRIYTLDI